MNDLLRRSAAHVFVEDVTLPVLAGEDAHHLARVLRLRDGQAVSVSDGRGSWRMCEWRDGSPVPTGEPVTEEPVIDPLTIALAPVKGDRTDDAVEKLVEIGIDRIVVLMPLEHSVVRWDPDRAGAAVARYGRIARSAAAQSRRVFLPVVEGPLPLDQVLSGRSVAIAEPGGDPDLSGVDTIVIGPEGGFSAQEVALAGRRIDLGRGILRADTAAVVAGALMVAHRRR